MENTSTSKETAEDLFFKFMDAEDCPEITHTFHRLVKLLGIKTENPREFYSLLKGKLQSWRCKSLWELLDCRANQKEYGKGKICEDTQVLVIGAGPIGLRTAIEVALLGSQVVIVEKRESFTRNNVLHLWPFLLTDFRSLGAKKFYGKFCCGSIDHISIRRLQASLLKTALIFGAKLYTGVTFEQVMEPKSLEDGWKCQVSPENHPVSSFEFDVLIGADGKKNVLPGFQQIEMRGTLAIGITANFVNHGTEEEANVQEISGIAYQFNPQFFDKLLEQKGIKLENIVYYKDETHYFVMTAGKASLLKRGALKEDFSPPSKLLAPANIDQSKLLEYVTDVVKYATEGTLKNLELKVLRNNQPDIAAFDFTSIKKAEHAARIIERKGSKLLVALVGDSLLEPFWPTGSGCARGVLSALDAAWMIRSFAQDKPPLQILSERENIYRLLSGTSAENLHKDHGKYTINPSTRYLHITHKKIREVYHLYDTDDAVNADFSIGSPQTVVNNKASRRRRISTGAKFTSSKGRKRGRANLAADLGESRIRSTSGSSVENLVSHKALSSTRSVPLDSALTASSAASDDEVFEKEPRQVRIGSPKTVRGRRSTAGSSGDELKGKRKKGGRKRTTAKENLDIPKEEKRKKGFFGFGKSKPKRKVAEDSDHYSDKDVKLVKVRHKEDDKQSETRPNFVRDDSWNRNRVGSFSREQYTRRSARDIIREMEARSKGEVIGNGMTNDRGNAGKPFDSKSREKDEEMKTENKKLEEEAKLKKDEEKKKHKEEEKKRKEEEKRRKDEEKRKHEEEKKKKEENEKARKKHEDDIKRREHVNNLHNKAQTTPANKKSKKQSLLDEIAKISPSAKRAIPVLSKLSPESDKENEKMHDRSVTSAVRDAAMLLMATPLLIDGLMPKKGLDRTGSWLGRGSGRVRDVIHRYNTLTDMKSQISNMNGDVTPLKRPRDSVDGPEGRPRNLNSNSEGQDGKVSDSTDLKQTLPLQLKTEEEKHLRSSPSLERLKLQLQGYKDNTVCAEKEPSSPNGKPTVDFSSPIWQKTPIAAMVEANTENDKAPSEPLKILKEKGQETGKERPAIKSSRRSSVTLSTEQLEENLTNLLNDTTAQKAWESIKYMLGIFRQIQKHPNEEKYYRIFNRRVKFRKHVWTMRNAKSFMTACGWTEVGSFVIFPLSKQIEAPLLLLNKYLCVADEKRQEERNSSGKANHPNLRKSSSSDLAEKILELKEALISSRSKTRSLSSDRNEKPNFLRRTVSVDEVNNLRKSVEESSSLRQDIKQSQDDFQKDRSRFDQERENEPARNLRRSLSENVLFSSPQKGEENSIPLSPFTRRFSQRGVKELETACDLVMENPLNVETTSTAETHTRQSIGLSDREEIPDVRSIRPYPAERQTVQSPREAVLEEADELSSLLGNMLATMGSSTESEKESNFEKDVRNESECKKVNEISDKHRDVELESLCETLDLLIQDNSSDSLSESEEEGIKSGRRYNLRQGAGHKSAFKPAMHPSRRKPQQLGKAKSLDENSKRISTSTGRSSHEKATKANSLDVTTSSSAKRVQESAMKTKQNTSSTVPKKSSKTAPKKTSNQRGNSVKTRAQRQKQENSSRVSESVNQRQVTSNKRESSVVKKPPALKQPAYKTKSLDSVRPKTRPPTSKSKSLDYMENGGKNTESIKPKPRSLRSSISDDNKKAAQARNPGRARIPSSRQDSEKGKGRESLGTHSKLQGRKSSSTAKEKISTKEPPKLLNADTGSKGSRSNQVVPEYKNNKSCSDQLEDGNVDTREDNDQKSDNWKANEEINLTLAGPNKSDEDLFEIVKDNEINQSEENFEPHYNHDNLKNSIHTNGDVKAEEIKKEEGNCQDSVLQDSEQSKLVEQKGSIKEISRKSENVVLENIEPQTTSRKMTLLDIGKQQSQQRLQARKEVVSLSLEERKQQILEAAVTKSKSKPADKRRSILQIKSRNDGNLVKNKKEAFEKPDVTRTTSSGSVDKHHRKHRHFRFHGRRKRSFELSNEQLEVVQEDCEEEGQSTSKNGLVPFKQDQDTRLGNGVSAESKIAMSENIEKSAENEKSHSPVKISPFQLRFVKRRGSYDLEKRANRDSLESQPCQSLLNEYDC